MTHKIKVESLCWKITNSCLIFIYSFHTPVQSLTCSSLPSDVESLEFPFPTEATDPVSSVTAAEPWPESSEPTDPTTTEPIYQNIPAATANGGADFGGSAWPESVFPETAATEDASWPNAFSGKEATSSPWPETFGDTTDQKDDPWTNAFSQNTPTNNPQLPGYKKQSIFSFLRSLSKSAFLSLI